jgi:superfamily I DNA/RNA helicase
MKLFEYATVRPIYGPPGTGKTTRCIAIVSDLLEQGVDPRQIAYVAFTRKAAWEAQDRIVAKLGVKKSHMQHFSTIHAMANRAFKSQFPDSFDVMKSRDYEEIGQRLSMPVRGHWRNADDDGILSTGGGFGYGSGDFAMSQIALARSRMIPIGKQLGLVHPENFASFRCDPYDVELFERYLEKYKVDEGKYDFNDMLTRSARCEPLPLRYAIIDEAQDLSMSQWAVCHHLLKNCESIWVAGDDDQAIYRFGGADATTFLKMGAMDTAEVLDVSYRLSPPVYRYSSRIVARIHDRVTKDFHPHKDVGGSVSTISSLASLNLDEGDWLLLVRNRAHMKEYEEYLRAKTYAYKVDNRSSVSKADTKAIQGWEHVRHGQGISREAGMEIFKRLRGGKGVKHGMKSKVGENLPKDKEALTFADLTAAGLLVPDQVPWFDALQGIPADMRFYLRGVAATGELGKENRININTIHGVKGGEKDNVVIMPQMGRLTWDNYLRDPDDEHRCAYVAATRAKENLYIYRSINADPAQMYPYPPSGAAYG